MSQARIISSRILGEDVEQAKLDLEVGELECEEAGLLKVHKNPENEELLNRSVIVVDNSPTPTSSILSQILSEGVNCLTMKPMGGPLHLITFESLEDKLAMIESKWLSKWFMEIRNVNNSCTTQWRETWIKVYGVPLAAWSYDNFYKIGCIFGKVLSVRYDNFDCASILTVTDCLFKINCKMGLMLMEKSQNIHMGRSHGDAGDGGPGGFRGGEQQLR